MKLENSELVILQTEFLSVFKLLYKSFVRMYELILGENPWPIEMYTRCDVKCQYFVSFAQDSFLATELSLGLETITNETSIQISHGSV
jgi:hypothetical protein